MEGVDLQVVVGVHVAVGPADDKRVHRRQFTESPVQVEGARPRVSLADVDLVHVRDPAVVKGGPGAHGVAVVQRAHQFDLHPMALGRVVPQQGQPGLGRRFGGGHNEVQIPILVEVGHREAVI